MAIGSLQTSIYTFFIFKSFIKAAISKFRGEYYTPGNTNPVKMGRCVKELERIYGIKQGRGGDTNSNNFNWKTQQDLAKELDLSQAQLINYKKLTETIPEIQDLIATQKVSATVDKGIL